MLKGLRNDKKVTLKVTLKVTWKVILMVTLKGNLKVTLKVTLKVILSPLHWVEARYRPGLAHLLASANMQTD